MLKIRRSQIQRYGIAVLAVAIALLLKLLLNPLIDRESPFLLFFAAVLASTWYGGWGAGVVSTVLSALVSDYFFLTPKYSLFANGLGQNVRLLLFVFESLAIAYVIATLQATKRRAERSKLEAQHHEAELRQSEEKFRLLVEGVKDYAILILNPDGYVASWNAGAEAIKGYQAAEIIGKHFSCFYDRTDIERGLPEQALQTAASTGRFEDEGWRVRKDSSRFYANVLITALHDKSGNLQGFSKVMRDITDRKLVEQVLQEANQRTTKILESITNAFVAVDTQWRYTYVNHQAEQLLGKTREELIGKNCWELFPEIINSQAYTHAHRAVAEQISIEYEDFFITFNKWFAIRLYPSLNGLSVYFQDITERKQIAKELQSSEARYRSLVVATSQAVWTTNAEGEVVEDIPQWRSLTGQSEEEVKGWAWVNAIHPEDRDRTAQLWNYAVQTKSLYEDEYRLQTADGTYRYFSARGVPVLDENGEIREWVGTSTNINARKQAESALRANEEKLRSFVEANVIGIMFGDVDGGIQEANDEFLRIVGFTQQELGAGQVRWSDITPPELLYLDEQGITEAKARGMCTPYEKEYIRKDGSRIPVLVGYVLVKEERQESIAFILDLTERKQMEESLRQKAEELTQANRMKDEFLAVVSHELRSPLNSILGWTQMLRGRKLNETMIAKALETIERNARAQTQLIEDLLDVSRIITGKVRLNVRPCQLVSIVEAAIDTVRPSADAKSIRLQSVLDPAAGPISGDSDRLQQVIWNLLSNAIKFTPKGGRVHICLERINSHVEIMVSDTGKGISTEFLPYVFDRFRQADSSSTRSYGGLGLGLAIVRHLVELHGGTVQVESPGEGLGTTFTVNLPLMAVRLEAIEAERVHPTVGQGVPFDNLPSLAGLQVLVVDDEADTREFLTTVLEQCGAQVRAVKSVREALEAIAHLKPDVLVSDIGMPEEDGYTLIRQVRRREAACRQTSLLPEQGGKIPAVALTAYARAEDRTRSLKEGFQMHLPKPIEPAELVTVVASLTGRT